MSPVPESPPGSDPARIGPYRLLGRLGSGGQGVVFLAEDEAGRRVAIKLLRRTVASGPGRTVAEFAAEIEASRRVASFCTAKVLGTGEVDGAPYVVSEYVEGPTLARRVAERGTLGGAELDRLAIGTMTALVAIHQAGVVHRDFKPANVLLGRDGPRVIDFGIARALDTGTVTGEKPAGTPPYMAPEQLEGTRVGAKADLFAWGSTMVYAASGRPAFGTGPLPVVINGILNGEPDLGPLGGDLRELVAECLSKDPADRPSSTQALLRLLGLRAAEPGILEQGRDRATPPPERTTLPAPLRMRRGRIAAGAAALLLAAVAAAVLPRPWQPPPPPSPGPTRPAAAPASAVTPAAMPSAGTTPVRVPDSKIVLYENAADPVRVLSYRFTECCDPGGGYVREPGSDAFRKVANFHEVVVAPGGRLFSLTPTAAVINPEYSYIRIAERSSGRETRVRLVSAPLETYHPHWTRDGGRVLLTIYEGVGGERRSRGFVIVDVVRVTVDVVRVADEDGKAYQYVWGPGEDTVLHGSSAGDVRVHALDGRVVRTLPGVGELTLDDASATALGNVFVTHCPDKSGDICAWDVTGVKKGVIPLPDGVTWAGWIGDRHFRGDEKAGRTTRVTMFDLRGRPVRLLAEGPAGELGATVLWWS